MAWIIIDREAGDILLPAGDSFVVPSDQMVVIGALSSSLTLHVQGARAGASGADRPGSRVWERLRKVLADEALACALAGKI